MSTRYEVLFSSKCEKQLERLPKRELLVLKRLVDNIMANGPVQPLFMNYGKLGRNSYNCHLSYRWCACWRNENGSVIVEVYYVGTRENAPY